MEDHIKVEWTEKAKSFLPNKEYRYLSPVVLVRNSDEKVTQLHSVALTNTSAISGMKPIINSLSIPTEQTKHASDETQAHYLKMLNISKQDFDKYKNVL